MLLKDRAGRGHGHGYGSNHDQEVPVLIDGVECCIRRANLSRWASRRRKYSKQCVRQCTAATLGQLRSKAGERYRVPVPLAVLCSKVLVGVSGC